MTPEERHCYDVACEMYALLIRCEHLRDLLIAERADARRQALEEAAATCERARPHGGRAWTAEQAACFEALSHVADHLNSLSSLCSEGNPATKPKEPTDGG